MPDRVIRDELLESTRWLGLPVSSRLAFIALLLTVDDFGNLESDTARLRRLWRDCCGIRTDAAAEKCLQALSKIDLVRLYEVDGKRYLHLPRFKQKLRFPTSVWPMPAWQAETYVPDVTGSAWRAKIRPLVLERDGHKCALCGSTGFLHVDHAVPLAAGGRSTIDNLITLCRKCNCTKSHGNLWTKKLLAIIHERNTPPIDPHVETLLEVEVEVEEKKGSSPQVGGNSNLPPPANGARARARGGRREIRATSTSKPSVPFIDRWWDDEDKTRLMADAVDVPMARQESWADWRHRIFDRIRTLQNGK